MSDDKDLDYKVWEKIDYQPAVHEFLPKSLLSNLSPGQKILEVGCNTGCVALWLAKQGYNVLGVDINPDAIKTAQNLALEDGLDKFAQFRQFDILSKDLDSQKFDAVVLIRLLTCIPNYEEWLMTLTRVHDLIAPGGFIYVHDFLLDVDNNLYNKRYDEYNISGQRYGNFLVKDSDGDALFVAHHHKEDEVNIIKEPYKQILYKKHRSLSMNGNSCLMFELIGQKNEFSDH